MDDATRASKELMVSSVNHLSAQWSAMIDGAESITFSAFSAWVGLAALLSGADGEARRELEAALSLEMDKAAAAVGVALEHALSRGFGLAAALWVRPDVVVRSDFVEALGRLSVGPVPDDVEELHQWVAVNTNGLIAELPIEVSPSTLLVLAAALALDGEWRRPFKREGDRLTGQADSDDATVIRHGRVTVSRIRLRTRASFEVHLLAGEVGTPAGDVLGAGHAALRGTADVVTGSDLEAGDRVGCFRVAEETRLGGNPIMVEVSLPAFEILSHHDLMESLDLFGLRSAATDATRGHFPGMCDKPPLMIGSATQTSLARLTESGFQAAAVTATLMFVGLPAVETVEVKVIRATFDHSFGFLVVDSTSDLVLTAGWVANERSSPHTS